MAESTNIPLFGPYEIALDAWKTDGYLLGLEYPEGGEISRCFVSGASCLRRGDMTLMDSLSKLSAIFRSGADLEIVFDGQPTLHAGFRAKPAQARVCVNGQEQPVRYDPDTGLARVRRP